LDEIKLKENKCLVLSVILVESFLTFFSLTMLDALASFGTIYPDFWYYLFKISLTTVVGVLMIGRFFRMWNFKEVLTA